MNFPYVLSDEILLRSKYEKKIGKNYVLSDCPSLYSIWESPSKSHTWPFLGMISNTLRQSNMALENLKQQPVVNIIDDVPL